MSLSKLNHDKAIAHLKKDKFLKLLIEKYEITSPNHTNDLFKDLIESIINQQLSGKAAATIFNRFKLLFRKKFPTPQQILKIQDDKIRACGISYPKIRYIKGICEAIISGSLDLKKIPTLSDEEVIIELTKLKGVGRWTAEMILMFSLQRPDVFSTGDLGLRAAVSKLYKVERENIQKIQKISLRWSPYRTLAARYLWRSLENRS